jgi:hypothetical protein
MKKMGASRGFYPYLPLPNSVPVDGNRSFHIYKIENKFTLEKLFRY